MNLAVPGLYCVARLASIIAGLEGWIRTAPGALAFIGAVFVPSLALARWIVRLPP